MVFSNHSLFAKPGKEQHNVPPSLLVQLGMEGSVLYEAVVKALFRGVANARHMVACKVDVTSEVDVEGC